MEKSQSREKLLAEVTRLKQRIAELELLDEERLKGEIALWANEERYRTLFERIPIGMYRTTPASEIIDANLSFFQMLGYADRGELLQVKASDLHADPEARKTFMSLLNEQGVLQGYELRLRRKDGSLLWVRDSCRAVRNSGGELLYYEGSIEDITRKKETEDALARALVEKEALLNELQHRVKNSLAMIGSLVRLELKRSTGAESRRILENLNHRIQSTANLYTILFSSGTTKAVKLDRYIHYIVNDLTAAYIPEGVRITIVEKLDDITIEAKRGVPFGLIVNEILTNILKYAFPDNRTGRIQIVLQKKKGTIVLIVSDDGIGLPEGFDLNEPSGMGMHLVKMMASQLQGSITLDSSHGTVFRIEVPQSQ